MPKRKDNGIDLYYEIHGQGEPLVLIMGLRRNAESLGTARSPPS